MFGPGTGMLLRPKIIQKAIETQEAAHGKAYNILFSPKGKTLDQPMLRSLAQVLQDKKHMMLLPARYEGMDACVEEEYADCLLSIGNYVLMGGDISVMVLMEGMLRLVSGIVGKEESVIEESYTGPYGQIVKTDVSIAKNYLAKEELESLGRIVGAYLDLSEERAKQKIPMTMEDWAKRMDIFLEFDEREILLDSGKILAKLAKVRAESEFEKYRIVQDRLFESDFDKVINQLTLLDENIA